MALPGALGKVCVVMSSTASRPPARTHASKQPGRVPRPPAVSRIAAGIDGFPEGRDAATLGRLLAEATGAELLLVAVHSVSLLPQPPELSDARLRKESQRVLREVRDSFAPGARTATVTDHSVARSLQRAIQRHHRDLLVVGSSRQGPEGRVRIGKRTRQLLCHFECALAVAPRGLHKDPRPLRRVGVGFDGGPESDAALELAASLAVAAGAELRVQTVVDDRLPGPARSSLRGVLSPSWDEVIEAEMERMREQAVTAGQRTEATPDVAVARGRPASALLALSETVDLLVIGSRRWGPTARLLLGSTGEALMHDAACPVLAVPRPGR
jgi:nucleotide-binding universal stress UspA family protein